VIDGRKVSAMRKQLSGPETGVLLRQDDHGLTLPPNQFFEDGARFLLSEGEKIAPIWGDGDTVLWSEGEPCVITGPTGIGKSTLALAAALALVRITSDSVLGFPMRAEERVLYIAIDRPKQLARAGHRLISTEDEAKLADRLVVWRWPLPFDIRREPNGLLRMAQAADAGTIVLDAFKDTGVRLAEEEGGMAIAAAMQRCVSEGVEFLGNHHHRKSQQGGSAPKNLDDVYGSAWITAGAGSVITLWGKPGDLVIELRQLNSPNGEFPGPWPIALDNETGALERREEVSVLDIVRSQPGIAAREVARALFNDDSERAIQKARRKLKKCTDKGLLQVHTKGKIKVYFPTEWSTPPFEE
jgi:replicative DNA helicase